MRIRTLSAALVASLLPLTACEPPDDGETSPPEATEVSRELPPEPDYGARTMACDTVEAFLEIDTEATRLDEDQAIRISLEDGELVTDPERAVVGLGEPLRWSSERLSWVVAFQGGLSPLSDDAGEMFGGPTAASGDQAVAYSEQTARDVPQDTAKCGYYYYLVAAFDPETGRVHVTDPPLWIID